MLKAPGGRQYVERLPQGAIFESRHKIQPLRRVAGQTFGELSVFLASDHNNPQRIIVELMLFPHDVCVYGSVPSKQTSNHLNSNLSAAPFRCFARLVATESNSNPFSNCKAQVRRLSSLCTSEIWGTPRICRDTLPAEPSFFCILVQDRSARGGLAYHPVRTTLPLVDSLWMLEVWRSVPSPWRHLRPIRLDHRQRQGLSACPVQTLERLA